MTPLDKVWEETRLFRIVKKNPDCSPEFVEQWIPDEDTEHFTQDEILRHLEQWGGGEYAIVTGKFEKITVKSEQKVVRTLERKPL